MVSWCPGFIMFYVIQLSMMCLDSMKLLEHFPPTDLTRTPVPWCCF